MGGEKVVVVVVEYVEKGSPPHGRGKDGILCQNAYPDRITPAWAGKSILCRSTRCGSPDHPRMGGEKMILPMTESRLWGSPPHGRGKATLPMTNTALVRITPAWAGKSGSCTYAVHPQRDHPRMGGEKLMFIARTASRLGSPPHGRGKAELFPMFPYDTGITPAWAGKSPVQTGKVAVGEDHPRMGGEKF